MHLGRTVAELEDSIGSGELTEWAAYYQIEPFGQWRDNWNIAHVSTILANRWRKKTDRPLTIDDFIYRTSDQETERQTKKTLAALQSMAKSK